MVGHPCFRSSFSLLGFTFANPQTSRFVSSSESSWTLRLNKHYMKMKNRPCVSALANGNDLIADHDNGGCLVHCDSHVDVGRGNRCDVSFQRA